MIQETKKQIEAKKIIAIARTISGEPLYNFAGAILKGGVELLEVTYNQTDPAALENTAESIRQLIQRFPQMVIGAGTVLNREQVKAAADAGAKYIVAPNTDVDVIKATKELGLISIPGAMTPTEIMTAHNAGADYIKLFPCDYLGKGYIKDIFGPISHLKFIATGGISAENLETYLSLGILGAGIGGQLCNKKLIAEGKFDEIEAYARKLTDIAASIKG